MEPVCRELNPASALSHLALNPALALTSCSCHAWTWERPATLCLTNMSPPLAYVWLLDSQECVELFKVHTSWRSSSCPSPSCQAFWWLLLATISLVSSVSPVKSHALNISDTWSLCSDLLPQGEFWIRLNKYKPFASVLQGSPDRVKQIMTTIIWRRGVLCAFQHQEPLQEVGCPLPGLGEGLGRLRMPYTATAKIPPFLFVCTWLLWPWTSPSSAKVESNSFCSFICYFCGRTGPWNFLPCHFPWTHSVHRCLTNTVCMEQTSVIKEHEVHMCGNVTVRHLCTINLCLPKCKQAFVWVQCKMNWRGERWNEKGRGCVGGFWLTQLPRKLACVFY
jgi:hypothetical protein